MRDFVDVDDIWASLDKETKEDVIDAKEISKDFLPTASYGVNRLIGGGFRLGHQHTVWGAEGSAKTAFMLQTVGINQKLGVPCFWFDAEGVFDPDWAEELGVDVGKLKVSRQSLISNVTDKQVSLVRNGFGLIVIDSTSELVQSSFVDKSGEIKNFDDTKQLGTQAKDLGAMSKMVQAVNYGTAIVHISQARIDVGNAAQNKPFQPTGGKELRHNDVIRLRLSGTKANDKQIKEEIQYGSIMREQAVGTPITWALTKNRLNGVEDSGVFDFYKKGASKTGVDSTGEIVEEAVKYGVVTATSWFTYKDHKAQGKRNFVKYLDAHPEVLKEIEEEIDAKSV